LIRAPIERLLNTEIEIEKRKNLIGIIYQNTEKLLKLTDKLLDFRKTESSQFSLQLEKKSIHKLLTLCLAEFQPLIEEKNLVLSFHSSHNNIEASIDVEEIGRAHV